MHEPRINSVGFATKGRSSVPDRVRPLPPSPPTCPLFAGVPVEKVPPRALQCLNATLATYRQARAHPRPRRNRGAAPATSARGARSARGQRLLGQPLHLAASSAAGSVTRRRAVLQARTSLLPADVVADAARARCCSSTSSGMWKPSRAAWCTSTASARTWPASPCR